MSASFHLTGRSIEHHAVPEPINSVRVRPFNLRQILKLIQDLHIFAINLIQIFYIEIEVH